MAFYIINYIKFLNEINIRQFVKLNYFCDSVVRLDKSKVIPYKNAIIDIEENAKIYLSKGDIEIGCDKIKNSKEETRVRIRKNGIWSAVGGARIAYGTTIEVLTNAVLNSKFFTMNSNCVLVSAKCIKLGKDTMIGRNVVIYDSDFHPIYDKYGKVTNDAEIVEIGDHVWVGTNVFIMKGAEIGMGSVVGANAVVKGTIAENTIFYLKGQTIRQENYGKWMRK